MCELKLFFALLLAFSTTTTSISNIYSDAILNDTRCIFCSVYAAIRDFEVPILQSGQQCSPVNAKLVGELHGSEVLMENIVKDQQYDSLSLVTRYVGVGYDLIRGSPEGDFDNGGNDPGIKITHHIFSFTYKKKKKVYYKNQPMSLPDQVNFHAFISCKKNSETRAFSGAKSYQKELSVGIKVQARYKVYAFSASTAVDKVEHTMKVSKNIFMDRKKICNYEKGRYIEHGGVLSNEFHAVVSQLPVDYCHKKEKLAYLRFIEEWGTDVIIEADLGTKEIDRFSSSYIDTIKFLSTKSSSRIRAGITHPVGSASTGINVDSLNEKTIGKTKFGKKAQHLAIGSKNIPAPIKINLKPIYVALNPSFWSEEEYQSLKIGRKQENLEKARWDYAKHVGKRLKDPNIRVKLSWPKGTYALPETTSGCPSHEFIEGCRYQDSEDRRNKNWFHGTGVLRGAFSRNMEMCYCVKNDNDKSDFTWPAGTYCIAKKGNKPHENFHYGMIRWDDENKKNRNRKTARHRLPDGKYFGNTIVEYWCCDDGSPKHPILLPTAVPFVLYQYKRMGCQKVSGMSVKRIMIYSDDENKKNKNKCRGYYPYNNKCSKNQRLYLCYYSSNSLKQQPKEYRLVGTFEFRCMKDPGGKYEAKGYLIIEFAGKRIEVWQSKHKSIKNKRSYRQRFKWTFETTTELKDLNAVLYGRVTEDDIGRDDLIGDYNNKKIRAKYLLRRYRTFKFRGGKNYVKISMRLFRKR